MRRSTFASCLPSYTQPANRGQQRSRPWNSRNRREKVASICSQCILQHGRKLLSTQSRLVIYFSSFRNLDFCATLITLSSVHLCDYYFNSRREANMRAWREAKSCRTHAPPPPRLHGVCRTEACRTFFGWQNHADRNSPASMRSRIPNVNSEKQESHLSADAKPSPCRSLTKPISNCVFGCSSPATSVASGRPCDCRFKHFFPKGTRVLRSELNILDEMRRREGSSTPVAAKTALFFCFYVQNCRMAS